MDKIFRVNMTDLTTTVEDVPAEWAGLGGRALTSTIVATEVDPECHPLGEKTNSFLPLACLVVPLRPNPVVCPAALKVR